MLNQYINLQAKHNQGVLEYNLKQIHQFVHRLRRKAPQNRTAFARYVQDKNLIWYIMNNAWHLEKTFTRHRVPIHLQERFKQDMQYLEYCTDVCMLHQQTEDPYFDPWAQLFFSQDYDSLPSRTSRVDSTVISTLLEHEVEQRYRILAHLDFTQHELPADAEEDWETPFSIWTDHPNHLACLDRPAIHNYAYPELYMTEWTDDRIQLFLSNLEHRNRYFTFFLMSDWPAILFAQMNEAQRESYARIMQAKLWSQQRLLPPISFLWTLMEQLSQYTPDMLNLYQYALDPDTKKGIKRALLKEPFWEKILSGEYQTHLDLLQDMPVSYRQLKLWIEDGVFPAETPTVLDEITLY